MKISIKNGGEIVWEKSDIKSATLYYQEELGYSQEGYVEQSDEKMSGINSVVIDGFVDNVPKGYFVKSFNVEDFDKILLED